MKWDVVEVKPELSLSLHVRFADGTTGKVRFEPSYSTGVFQELTDQSLFQQVHVESGARFLLRVGDACILTEFVEFNRINFAGLI